MTNMPYTPTPDTMRCTGCGCDFKPTREQWLDFLRRRSEKIFCARPCWRAYMAREKVKRIEQELADPDLKKAKRRSYKESWLTKKKLEREARAAAEAAQRRTDEALAAKLLKATREHIEAIRRNAEESTRRNAPRQSAKKSKAAGLGPAEPLTPMRKCHTCGRPTWDYNCSTCRKDRSWCFNGDEYGGCANSAPGGIHR